MSNDSIPPDVRRFISEHIRSVLVLEVLLLLHREAGRAWHPDEVGRELRVDAAWTQQELSELAQRGIIRASNASPPTYTYETTNPAHPTISELATVYAERRVSVITFIFAKPTDPIQSFADAFKLRKDRQDG